MQDTTKIVGLELLSNPQKRLKKGAKQPIVKKQVHSKDTKQESQEEKFKKYMKKQIDDFKLPLESYEKSDAIKVQLEACWYFFNKTTTPNQK